MGVIHQPARSGFNFSDSSFQVVYSSVLPYLKTVKKDGRPSKCHRSRSGAKVRRQEKMRISWVQHSPTVTCFKAIPGVWENKVTKRLFHFVVVFNGDSLFAIALAARGHWKKSLSILAANVCVVFFSQRLQIVELNLAKTRKKMRRLTSEETGL